MISLKFAYLTFCALFFVPWAILFWRRKDMRRAMLMMGLIGAIGSFLTSYFWTIDWWLPETVTGTRMGIEDYILGISNGGIAAVLYIEIYRKRYYHFRRGSHDTELLLLVVLTCIVFWASFDVLGLTSFYACMLALGSYVAILAYMRKELLMASLANGVLMVLVAIPVYAATVLIFPDFATDFYVYPLVTEARLFTVPLQEFIFYFMFGLMVPLMYEYWQGLRLRAIATPARQRRQ